MLESKNKSKFLKTENLYTRNQTSDIKKFYKEKNSEIESFKKKYHNPSPNSIIDPRSTSFRSFKSQKPKSFLENRTFGSEIFSLKKNLYCSIKEDQKSKFNKSPRLRRPRTKNLYSVSKSRSDSQEVFTKESIRNFNESSEILIDSQEIIRDIEDRRRRSDNPENKLSSNNLKSGVEIVNNNKDDQKMSSDSKLEEDDQNQTDKTMEIFKNDIKELGNEINGLSGLEDIKNEVLYIREIKDNQKKFNFVDRKTPPVRKILEKGISSVNKNEYSKDGKNIGKIEGMENLSKSNLSQNQNFSEKFVEEFDEAIKKVDIGEGGLTVEEAALVMNLCGFLGDLDRDYFPNFFKEKNLFLNFWNLLSLQNRQIPTDRLLAALLALQGWERCIENLLEKRNKVAIIQKDFCFYKENFLKEKYNRFLINKNSLYNKKTKKKIFYNKNNSSSYNEKKGYHYIFDKGGEKTKNSAQSYNEVRERVDKRIKERLEKKKSKKGGNKNYKTKSSYLKEKNSSKKKLINSKKTFWNPASSAVKSWPYFKSK